MKYCTIYLLIIRYFNKISDSISIFGIESAKDIFLIWIDVPNCEELMKDLEGKIVEIEYHVSLIDKKEIISVI